MQVHQQDQLRPQDLRSFGRSRKGKEACRAGLCDSYVLMTNAGLSGTGAGKIKALFKAAGVKHVAIFGSTWISQQIRENKRLRMLVPRVYGLGDLSQILDERAYVQARAILESMREDLAKVVVTDAYRRAVDAINKHGFVLAHRRACGWQDDHRIAAGDGGTRPVGRVDAQARRSRQGSRALEPGRAVAVLLAG